VAMFANVTGVCRLTDSRQAIAIPIHNHALDAVSREPIHQLTQKYDENARTIVANHRISISHACVDGRACSKFWEVSR
jgi:hypothetical protein